MCFKKNVSMDCSKKKNQSNLLTGFFISRKTNAETSRPLQPCSAGKSYPPTFFNAAQKIFTETGHRLCYVSYYK
jgi:hypothetical protein